MHLLLENFTLRAAMKTFDLQATGDGSFTFFSAEFGQTYHSSSGAKQEAVFKYALATNLAEKAREARDRLRILDICYGLGYNSAAALAAIWQSNPACPVEIVALEIDPLVPIAATEQFLLADWPEPIPQLLAELARHHHFNRPAIAASLRIGDARQEIESLATTGWQADAIFLDPFSPNVCPQLWTVEFLGLVARCCQPDGLLATYSCAAAVRSALMAAGLTVADSPPIGRKAPGTIASPRAALLSPLSLAAQEHLQTRAAVPYRDPTLRGTAAQILADRHLEQQECGLESTSQWKKRWYPA
jgi:tRNA U34 5-methylaminomethyl-2-thiouridine-forming methyltransferase MnmC